MIKSVQSYRIALFVFFIFMSIKCDDNYVKEESKLSENEVLDNKSSNNLMVFNINTEGKEILDEPKIPSRLIITHDFDTLYNGNIGIEKRGSSSQYFYEKKQYSVETWSGDYSDIDVSLAGLPKEEDWIFYGPFGDKSLIRNVLIYKLSNSMGRYASRSKFMDVYINDDYKGIYVLLEKIKVDKNRVNISKTVSSDQGPNSGYMLKIDKPTAEDVLNYNDYNEQMSFSSKYNPYGDLQSFEPAAKVFFVYHYPKPEEISKAQKEYIQSFIHNFESKLASNDYKDPYNGYRRYIDVESFVDFFILNELSNNVDGYRLSTYMYKDISGKLKMGPIWDFNLAFGNANYCNGDKVNHWIFRFNNYCQGDLWMVPFWWERLVEDDYFKSKVINRWFLLRQDILSNDTIFDYLDETVEKLKASGSIDKNFKRWNILGDWIWPNAYVGLSYDDEIEYLKSWLFQRLAWIDLNIEAL
tara:strand:- start:1967 stop:3373 length:1407 start_codon:yes stop_codon:yes gene_type:complete